MPVIPLETRSQHVDFAYDQVVRPHRSYRPSGGLPKGKPRTRHMWICLQLSGARGVDNGGVKRGTHYVSLSNHCSAFTHVHSGVPQGSVLGPILFTMYIKPLSAIIDSHSIIHHSFAGDLQLQMSAPPDRISELLHSMQSCISDVKAWATANMLKLNDNKTELMLVSSRRTKHLHSLPTTITIGNAQIPFKKSVKNLGFTLGFHLTMNANVSNIARTCYFELRRLAYIRRFLTNTATSTLVSAFVLSRIDYCNSLLFGSTHEVTSHLQRIQITSLASCQSKKHLQNSLFALPLSQQYCTIICH